MSIQDLTEQEWDELQRLRVAISSNITSMAVDEMERFSYLFARTLVGKGNRTCYDSGVQQEGK